MWVGFYMAVMKAVEGLEQAGEMLATGTVSATAIDIDSKDELSSRVVSTLSQVANATNKMADTINMRTNELTEVSTLVAYMQDGVIITDADGVIKVLNPSATRLLGVGFGEAVNKSLYSFIPDPRFQATMVTALAAPRQRHLVDVALNNRIVSVSTVFAPVTQDRYEGMLILEDVTELRTLQHLQQARRTAPVR
jgi:PAS domain S-box-containing protein